MRFIAAFMVVICHARGYHWVEWGKLPLADQTPLVEVFYAITRPGNEWVVVFFVLSGFLVGGRAMERSLHGSFDLRLFAIDRITRIWVPLIPALLLSLFIALICHFPIRVGEFFGNIFGLQGVFFRNFGGNEPLWSLSYEIWFYVLIGAMGTLLVSHKENHSLPKSHLAAAVVLMLGFSIFTQLFPFFLFIWLLGAFCYFLVREQRRIGLLMLGVCMAVLGGICSQFRTETHSFHAESMVPYLPSWDVSLLFEGLGIGLLVVAICKESPHGSFMIAAEKTGTLLAAFSYTLYLTHYPIINLWEHYFPVRCASLSAMSIVLFFAKLISCLAVALLFYLAFESRTPVVRKWIKNYWRA